MVRSSFSKGGKSSSKEKSKEDQKKKKKKKYDGDGDEEGDEADDGDGDGDSDDDDDDGDDDDGQGGDDNNDDGKSCATSKTRRLSAPKQCKSRELTCNLIFLFEGAVQTEILKSLLASAQSMT